RRVSGHPDSDHRLAVETELHGVGHGDHLHDSGFGQPLYPLAYGGLAEPDCLSDLGIRPPSVGLQLLDDRFGEIIEVVWLAIPGCRSHFPILSVKCTLDKRFRTLPGRIQRNQWERP